ncbi:hypothetical protein O3P69_009815 [Scylla paramamosain]|uniref:Uncharacterized protein n=1 Tax=Scylla paramamosain TaxID=85552 RepID=A0AAW0SNS3_SCYPA
MKLVLAASALRDKLVFRTCTRVSCLGGAPPDLPRHPSHPSFLPCRLLHRVAGHLKVPGKEKHREEGRLRLYCSSPWLLCPLCAYPAWYWRLYSAGRGGRGANTHAAARMTERGAGGEQESHTDYYGSLECLPLAPLRKKPPPYASRRQQEARRGSYLKGILSSSTGDLTQAGNKTRVVNKSPGKDARGRTKDRGDSGLPPVCGEERGASGDVSSASGDATHVLSQHRCQGSVLYGSEGRKCSDDTDYHISKPVREEYTRKYSNGGTEQHLKNTENSRDWHAIENKATEKHRHLDHKMQRERERAEEQNIEKKAKKVDVNGRNCALSVDKVDVDGRSGPSLVEKVDYRKVSVYAEEKPHSTTSSPTSLSSPLSSVTYSPKDNEEGAKVAAITDEEAGVFVATPIFLEGGSSSSSASPSPSPSPPPLLLQGSDVSRNKLDSTDTKGREEEEEGKAALSTLRREILHLTRLKEEIEQNLLRSQSVLKKEVTGLRQEHGALAATVEERERQLHSQQAEIQDLKGTIKQLQALVFTSDTETRLQRQASDLQELLREEKRHHLEETTQLRREVKLLSSQLREKDHQLEKYRSSPSLASWSGDGVMGRPTKEWKTSLPDVRGGKEVLALGAPVAERRKSFSGVSDSSGDGPASWAGSLEHSTARSSDDVFEASYIAPVRSYTSAESCRISERPQVAPGRSNISVKSSRISEQPPTDASMSKHTPVGSDMIVRSSRKSERSPTGPSRSHLLSLRDTMPGDTQSGDEQGRGLVKTTLYVELHDYSKSGAVKEVPRGSHRSGSDDSPSSETPGHIKTRGHTEEGQRGKYLSRGGLEEDQREKYRSDDNRPFSKIPASVKTRGGSEMRPSDRTRADVHNKFPTKTQPVVTKPSQPSTVSLRPSRPSASPPSPPQVTREAGGNLTSPARQEPPISRVSGAQDSRPKQKALEDTSEGLGSSWQDPRGSRGVVDVRTSWMYKPVTGEATGRGEEEEEEEEEHQEE